jgi:parallel beta-helix repeat protein
MRPALLSAMLVILAVTSATADFYVPEDYATIQSAIDSAAPGERIHVAPGRYDTSSEVFPLRIDKPLHLLGAQAGVDPRPSQGGRTGDETILDAQEGAATVIQIQAAANVEINGFTITGGAGDMVRESGHADSLLFHYNILYDDLSTAGDEAIQIMHSTGVIIEYNYAFNIVQDAFNLSSSSNGVVRHNDAYGVHSENAAIYCYDATSIDVIGNVIANVPNNDGIKLGDSDDGSTGGLVADNTVYDCGEDGITIYASGVIVEHNVVHDCRSENGALYLYRADASLVRENRIFDNDAIGVLLLRCSGVSLIGNEIRNNDDWDDEKYPGSAGIWLTSDTELTTIHDNCLVGNADFGLRNDAAAAVVAEMQWWGDPSGPFHAALNPVGLGDPVSDNVGFSPWQLEDVCQVPADAGAAQGVIRPPIVVAIPNPAAGQVRILYTLPVGNDGATASLGVYDAAGRMVRHLDCGPMEGVGQVVTWDGMDHHGRAVGAGTYFCRLSQAGREAFCRVTLLQ